MKMKSINVFLTCLLLLSGFAVCAIACPPPPCPNPCEYWTGSFCYCHQACCYDSDCGSGIEECLSCHENCYCFDDDSKCPGECHTCSLGDCEDDDSKCNAANCEECVNGSCVDIGCDCTIPGPWRDMPVGTVDDECGNTLTLPLESLFCYYYNEIQVGNCPYTGPGRNEIGYWKTINNMRFCATYHKSWDNTNDGSEEDEGTKYKYDSVIWWYDCINDSGTPSKTGIEHPTVMGGDDGTGSAFEETYCPPI